MTSPPSPPGSHCEATANYELSLQKADNEHLHEAARKNRDFARRAFCPAIFTRCDGDAQLSFAQLRPDSGEAARHAPAAIIIIRRKL